MLKNVIPLLASILVTTSAYCENPWVATAHDYTERSEKPHEWDANYSKGIHLNDILRQLPPPQQWTALRADYAASLPSEQTSPAEAKLTQFLLSFLDGDTEAIEQNLEAFEAILKTNEYYDPSSTSELRRSLYQSSKEIAPVKLIEQFELQLKSHQPVTNESLLEIIGSPETLAQIDAYLDAQQAIIQEYVKLFASDIPEDAEAEMLKLQEKSIALEAKHSSASQAIQAHEDNPILAKYLQTRINPNIHNYIQSIAVPDLVTLAGEARARELLTQALSLPVQLNIDNADATLRLARELAIQHHEKLAVPQWHLVHAIGQVELYQLMQAKFPLADGAETSYEYGQARGYYFWGLVADARTDEAMAMIQESSELIDNLPYDAVRTLKKAGYGLAVWQFLDQLLLTYPTVDLWDAYMALSAELEKSEQMLETVKNATTAEGQSSDSTIQKQLVLASAYLSADQLDEGVRWLKQALATATENSEAAEAQFEAAEELIELGILLDQKEWIATGFASAKLDSIEFISEYGSINLHPYLSLARLHQKAGQKAQAHNLLKDLVTKIEQVGAEQVKKSQQQAKQEAEHFYGEILTLEKFRSDNYDAYQEALVAKMGLLVSKENYAAAHALLKEEKLWIASDVAELITESDTSPANRPFGWLVAKTLHEQGESESAAKVLEALLRERNGYDPAYALYLEIQGDAAIEYFDKLYTIDQFQERPLIWKAQHLINRGEIAAADKIATQAIAIDPSDGEQPKNDRMRVYDVMRQIRSAQGNTKEAAFFADVLKAIRLSENADDYYGLGLHTMAIQRYLQSLEFFQDAYCIQSRVAVRLYDEGRIDEAVVHYKKAYELMPSSFGRVESHCFGCESVFKGEQPQSIAEEVFSGLLVTQAETPQVHYLMGYLRDYQEREVEALKHLRDAVALDPDYLNAWKKIASLSRQMHFSAQERDQLTLKIYTLDPLGQHSSPRLNEVKDIKAMWRTVLANKEKLQLVPKRTQVYPLAAAQALKLSAEENSFRFNYNRTIEHPVDALQNNPVIEKIEDLYIQLSQEEAI